MELKESRKESNLTTNLVLLWLVAIFFKSPIDLVLKFGILNVLIPTLFGGVFTVCSLHGCAQASS